MPKSKSSRKKSKAKRQASEIVHTAERMAHQPVDVRRRRHERHQNACQRNADCWVRSLLDPFGCSARFPEPGGFPTELSKMEISHSVPAYTVGTYRLAATVFQAGLEFYAFDLSGGTAWNNVTWAGSHHPKRGAISATFELYRITSFGIRIRNCGKLLDRGGRLYVGSLGPRNCDATLPADLPQTITDNPERFRLVDAANLTKMGHLELTWRPLTVQGSIERSGVAHQSDSTGLGYKTPASDYVDSALCVMFISTDSTVSTDFVVEHVMNMEAVPNAPNNYLFDTKTAPGGQEAVAESLVTAAKAPGMAGWFKTGVKAVGEGLMSSLEKSFGHKARSQSLFSLGSSLGDGFLSLLVAPHHQRALAQAARQREEREAKTPARDADPEGGAVVVSPVTPRSAPPSTARPETGSGWFGGRAVSPGGGQR